jgi:hypothetical protein
MRAVEQAQMRLWDEGLVPGELHTGIGEEGVVAGVLLNLVETDALALDHRPTPALVARRVDLERLLLEIMGHEDGLNGGWGGHMHLFAPSQRAAADGIVGSSGPLACGLAPAARRLHPGSVAVAFFGEAAMNEGHMLEAFNLASARRLPVLFVCKDNAWSIATRSGEVTGGALIDRARAFGLTAAAVDGGRADEVQKAAARLVARLRDGKGPAFLLAKCYRPQGHVTTDVLVRLIRDPRAQAGEIAPHLLAAVRAPGGTRADRAAGLATLTRRIGAVAVHHARRWRDPLAAATRRIGAPAAARIDLRVAAEVGDAKRAARRRVAANPDAPMLRAAPSRESLPILDTAGSR